MADFFRKKKKVCPMCSGKEIDYKNVDFIIRFISKDKGKILPRRVTGCCAEHQRVVAREVKRARFMALIPFVK